MPTLRYFISVVPRAEQSPGFALVIDRRSGSWTDIQVHILVLVVVFILFVLETKGGSWTDI